MRHNIAVADDEQLRIGDLFHGQDQLLGAAVAVDGTLHHNQLAVGGKTEVGAAFGDGKTLP